MMQPAQHIDAELAAAARQHWNHCVLPDRKPFEQLIDLIAFAHAQLADRRDADTGDFLTPEKHLPCGRGQRARKHGKEGGISGAVRTDDTAHIPFRQRTRHNADGSKTTVLLGDAARWPYWYARSASD